jgi:hypothetical protein
MLYLTDLGRAMQRAFLGLPKRLKGGGIATPDDAAVRPVARSDWMGGGHMAAGLLAAVAVTILKNELKLRDRSGTFCADSSTQETRARVVPTPAECTLFFGFFLKPHSRITSESALLRPRSWR